MAVKANYIDLLVNIPGFTVSRVQIHELKPEEEAPEQGTWAYITLFRTDQRYQCQCGREFTTYYDWRTRSVRDLPYGPHRYSYLFFAQMRVNCPECGVVTERLPWVGPRVDYTKRLALAVAWSCRETRNLTSIAKQYGLHPRTVKRMDQEALEQELPEPSEAAPRLVGVDEVAIKKHHHYATVVADLEKKTVPYVAEHRTKESLAGFYQALGPEKCEQIAAVALDLWKPYQEATREYCPNAELVYDPFHLLMSYGRDVIDKVRVQEFNRASAHHQAVILGSKYLLLKNREHLDPAKNEPARLAELLRLNRRLAIVYTLKDDLKHLWSYRSETWARKWFAGWYRRAIFSRIKPLKKFARKLKDHLPGLLAHCRYPLHTGFLEGVNNKIKVIKRIAYGFHDLKYFFLKIRGAFHHA